MNKKRTCERDWCDTKFSGPYQRRFCSTPCSQNRPPKEVRLTERNCQWSKCNKTFMPRTYVWEKYCSPKCQHARNSHRFVLRRGMPARKKRALEKESEMHTVILTEMFKPKEIKEIKRGNPAISKLLKAYNLGHDKRDRQNGVLAELKAELLEARLAKGAIFSEEEYLEEIEHLAKKFSKTVNFLKEYASSLTFERQIFSYERSYTLKEDFRETFPFIETVYLLPGYFHMT